MENTQAESIVASMEIAKSDISQPLQTLFDECLNYISLYDFDK